MLLINIMYMRIFTYYICICIYIHTRAHTHTHNVTLIIMPPLVLFNVYVYIYIYILVYILCIYVLFIERLVLYNKLLCIMFIHCYGTTSLTIMILQVNLNFMCGLGGVALWTRKCLWYRLPR